MFIIKLNVVIDWFLLVCKGRGPAEKPEATTSTQHFFFSEPVCNSNI